MSKPTLVLTVDDLAQALTEWDRRWRDDPEAFMSEAASLAQDPETYGEAAGPYLVSILVEIAEANTAREAQHA